MATEDVGFIEKKREKSLNGNELFTAANSQLEGWQRRCARPGHTPHCWGSKSQYRTLAPMLQGRQQAWELQSLIHLAQNARQVQQPRELCLPDLILWAISIKGKEKAQLRVDLVPETLWQKLSPGLLWLAAVIKEIEKGKEADKEKEVERRRD